MQLYGLLYRGIQIFRTLPKQLHELKTRVDDKPMTKEAYKARLDKYLSTIPDEPTIKKRQRRATSNSLLQQTQYRNKDVNWMEL